MSHTVTVTRTMTASTTEALLLNVGYVKTLPGILKAIHVLLGIITVSLLGHYIAYHQYRSVYKTGPNNPTVPDDGLFISELFFLLITTACLILSTLFLFSCLVSIATATILRKTILEVIIFSPKTFLLLVASLHYFRCLIEKRIYLGENEAPSVKIFIAVLGIINSVFYAVAVFFAYRHFKSG